MMVPNIYINWQGTPLVDYGSFNSAMGDDRRSLYVNIFQLHEDLKVWMVIKEDPFLVKDITLPM